MLGDIFVTNFIGKNLSRSIYNYTVQLKLFAGQIFCIAEIFSGIIFSHVHAINMHRTKEDLLCSTLGTPASYHSLAVSRQPFAIISHAAALDL